MSEVLKHHSHLPHRTQQAHVMALVPSSRLSPARFVAGEVAIHWFLDITYQIVIKHGGRTLREGATYTDDSVELKGLEDAIRSARAEASFFQIDAESTAIAQVLVNVSLVPLLPCQEQSNDLFRRYLPATGLYEGDLDAGAAWLRLPPDQRVESELITLIGPKALVTDALAWSSKDAPAGNLERRQQVLNRLGQELEGESAGASVQ